MIKDSYNGSQNSIELVQNIILENRNKLSISGVKDVFSFDDQIVILDTDLGMITIKGQDIRISKLSLDTSDVIIDGRINSISYSEKNDNKSSMGIFNKLFK